MATQNLVEQRIVFISNDKNYDEQAIFTNSLIVALAQNSLGNDITYEYKQFVNVVNASTITYSALLMITCYVLPSFVATIQANIPNLQAAFPQYTVVTWGGNIVYGN